MLLGQGTPAFVVDIFGFVIFWHGALYIKGDKMGTPAFLPSFSAPFGSSFSPLPASLVFGPVPFDVGLFFHFRQYG